MLLQEPPENEYDLRFDMLGFPIRISWTFWLGAIVFGHGMAQGLDRYYGPLSPGILPLLLIWVCCLLVSILIHELGHTLAFRRYGIHSSVVLYHFGGLAIPSGSFMPGQSVGRLGPKKDLWIAAAGPLLQLASAGVLIAVVKLMGYQVEAFAWMPQWLLSVADKITESLSLPGMLDGNPMDSVGLNAIVICYLFPSILWAFLNLVPVWPLDGGRIARSLIVLGGGTVAQSLWVSVIAAGALCYYAFTNEQMMMGLFFGMFGFSNYQELQQQSHWRY